MMGNRMTAPVKGEWLVGTLATIGFPADVKSMLNEVRSHE